MINLFVWSVVASFPGGRPDPVQGSHVHTVHDQHTDGVRNMQDLLYVAHREVAHMPDLQTCLSQEVLHEGEVICLSYMHYCYEKVCFKLMRYFYKPF